MPQYSVFTNEYEADIVKLLKQRLLTRETDEASRLSEALQNCASGEGSCARISIENDSELAVCCDALSELICFDLRSCEMSEMLDRFNIGEEKKRGILESALRYSEYCVGSSALSESLKRYFAENERLNLEGFIRFRFRDRLEVWRAAVDSAIADEFESDEHSELLELLGILSVLNDDQDSVTVILNPDESCTIMSRTASAPASRRIRIDCTPGNVDGALHMLGTLDPKRIALIDLSFGACEELKKRIFELFTVE
ncbi:MAG: hypothetical protein IKZ82_08855 [Clostridia bacterium]|nr:hypothetical protein [Clostridia bacterium]